MSRDRNRRTMGIVLVTVGLLGFLVYQTYFTIWSYPIGPTSMGPMMGRTRMLTPMMQGWNYSKLEEVNGTVEKIEWM